MNLRAETVRNSDLRDWPSPHIPGVDDPAGMGEIIFARLRIDNCDQPTFMPGLR